MSTNDFSTKKYYKRGIKNGFAALLKRLRSKTNYAPTLEEITKEVKLVRAKRYM